MDFLDVWLVWISVGNILTLLLMLLSLLTWSSLDVEVTSIINYYCINLIFFLIEANQRCTSDSCSNGGSCVEQWSGPGCDCEMTSYTGPTCAQGSLLT